MAYSRVKKYQELRDGLKEEAGINREKTVDEFDIEKDDDDFLSFMKNDEYENKNVNIEDTLIEAKTFEQMRNESSKELEKALESAKRGVGKESQYNTRMDILSKIREPEKTTIKIDSVDNYNTEEFSKGMFLNKEEIEQPVVKERKRMTLMERLASMSPEEDVKKAEEFLKNEEEKQESIKEKTEEVEKTFSIEDTYEKTTQVEKIEKEQVESRENRHSRLQKDENSIDVIQDQSEEDDSKQSGKLIKVLDIVIAVLVFVFIVLLGVIIYQNFF